MKPDLKMNAIVKEQLRRHNAELRTANKTLENILEGDDADPTRPLFANIKKVESLKESVSELWAKDDALPFGAFKAEAGSITWDRDSSALWGTIHAMSAVVESSTPDRRKGCSRRNTRGARAKPPARTSCARRGGESRSSMTGWKRVKPYNFARGIQGVSGIGAQPSPHP